MNDTDPCQSCGITEQVRFLAWQENRTIPVCRRCRNGDRRYCPFPYVAYLKPVPGTDKIEVTTSGRVTA